jgi:hypothetical protein
MASVTDDEADVVLPSEIDGSFDVLTSLGEYDVGTIVSASAGSGG